jgi:hypothetical protein
MTLRSCTRQTEPPALTFETVRERHQTGNDPQLPNGLEPEIEGSRIEGGLALQACYRDKTQYIEFLEQEA